MVDSSSVRRNGLGDFAQLPDELICSILGLFSQAQDVGVISCVSSVFHVLCNEEPLWMKICLSDHEGPLVYKGSWKRTAIGKTGKLSDLPGKPIQARGFTSLYLYRRWYRCNVSLGQFVFDVGAIERKKNISRGEFSENYDMQKPVLLLGLADNWTARQCWTMSELVHWYGDVQFKVSQSYGQSIRMKLRDYADYMKLQHDEDPLYIFDSTFGETAPKLLKDYSVPDLFSEDLFSVLNPSQRPPFRWLVIGPARSGANWHVDPALTSAWNTLLFGRKRWAFYPPGRVPPGVFVHVDEDTGDVNYDSPSSLQWWLEVYPTLEPEYKPLECTQLPGETIFVPSGWWHCVLNIDETIAVTQNFVNSANMELVCIDMAPGFHHRGVARAGYLALENEDEEDEEESSSELDFTNPEFLKKFIKEHPDHFLSETNADGVLSRRDFRDWLRKLQVGRPDLRPLVWKCACLAVDANTWLERLQSICKAHSYQCPEDQQIPLGNGSSPVYLHDGYAIKLYVHEEGTSAVMREIDSELQFYHFLDESESPLKEYVPSVVAKGVVYQENDGSYKAVPCSRPDELLAMEKSLLSSDERKMFWPYLVAKRCPGQNLAQCRTMMKQGDYLELAEFLGQRLQELHSLSLPVEDNVPEQPSPVELQIKGTCRVPGEWERFVNLLRLHRQTMMKRLKDWGSVPRHLLQKLEEYVPEDPVVLIGLSKVQAGVGVPVRPPALLHMDIMEDNIQMIPSDESGEEESSSLMKPGYILDFGDILHGDPLYELVPLFTDVLEGNGELLEQVLKSYELPLAVPGLRSSYRAMCYCLLYKYDAMDTIFRVGKHLRLVESWDELELIVWGILNEYGSLATR